MTSEGTRSTPATLHHLLHGYDDGHRMLAFSMRPKDADLHLIDRLSDASGQRPSADNDGYITGYPLPSGHLYALAKTWYVPKAARPNVVFTHTLLLPVDAMSSSSVSSFASLFLDPATTPRSDYERPVLVPARMPQPSMQPDDQDIRALLSLLYRPSSDEVWFAADPVSRRSTFCLAVWDQQWPRLRSGFAFCSGALDGRRLGERSFDLLCVPQLHRSANQPNTGLQASREVVQALADDLEHPGELREFLWRVGLDSSRRRVMGLVVETYLNASVTPADPLRTLEQLTLGAPRPTSMRRLKREVLSSGEGLLSKTPAVNVLQAILAPDVAQCVLAADADLDGWAGRAWIEDANRVLASLPAQEEGQIDWQAPPPNESKQTVAVIAKDALACTIARQAAPRNLQAIAEHRPDIASHLLRSRTSEPAWWECWADLPDASFQEVVDSGLLEGKPEAVLGSSVSALWVGTLPDRWRAIRHAYAGEAVRELLDHVRPDVPVLPWVEVLRERQDLLVEALASGASAEALGLAADAFTDLQHSRQVPAATWLPLATQPVLWTTEPHRAAVLFIAALDDDSGSSIEMLARSYQMLYETFSAGQGHEAWNMLQPVVRAKRDEWDRCRRLVKVVARSHDQNGSTGDRVLGFLGESPARSALHQKIHPAPEPTVGDHHEAKDQPASTGQSKNSIESFFRSIFSW